MTYDPDPRYVEDEPRAPWSRPETESLARVLRRIDVRDRAIREVDRGRSSFRWYLLASFVTGLLLGAAVARL